MGERQALLFVNHLARPDSDFAALSHRDAKKQKNFFYAGACRWDRRGQTSPHQINKNFSVLFFKKELLS
jgi:hypothetical protein